MPCLEIDACEKATSLDNKHSWSFQKSRHEKRKRAETKTKNKKRCGLVPSLLSQKIPATCFRQYPSLTFSLANLICEPGSKPFSFVNFEATFLQALFDIENADWNEYDFFKETGYSFQQLCKLPVSSYDHYTCMSPIQTPTSFSLSPEMETTIPEKYKVIKFTSYLSLCIQENPHCPYSLTCYKFYAMLDVNSFLHLAFGLICQNVPSFLYDISALVIDYMNIFVVTKRLQHQSKKVYRKLEPSISWWFCSSSDCSVFTCKPDNDED